ncbi:S1C family serine protease [Haladaptatus sp. NG-WS-4]
MRNRPLTFVVVLVMLVPGGVVSSTIVSGNGIAHAQEQTCDFSTLYDQTIDSVVAVRVETPQGVGEGSGFVYETDGTNDSAHIVTNQHVIAMADDVEVQFNEGEFMDAEVVGTSPEVDLAVLQVEGVPNYSGSLPLAETPAEPGESVAAIGNPLGLQGTITEGVVSGVNRTIPVRRGFSIPGALQTDAAINPGNSGGPLVSCEGRVVGVNTAGIAEGENLGFAIPASVVREEVPPIIENAERPNGSMRTNQSVISMRSSDAPSSTMGKKTSRTPLR